MKTGARHVISLTRILALAAALTGPAAHADEYGEVSQLLREGKFVEAQARVDRHLQAKPKDPQLRFYKGVIQRESGRHGEALATFSKLSEDHPDLPEPYNNLAVIYAAQGQYDKARVALEKALRTNPAYATAHDNLGDIYAKLSSQAYSKALQIEGGSPPAPARLALIKDLTTTPASQRQAAIAVAQAPAPAPARVTPAAPAPAPTVTPAQPIPPKPAPAVTVAVTPAPKPAVQPPPATAAPKPVPAQPASSPATPATVTAVAPAPKAVVTPPAAPPAPAAAPAAGEGQRAVEQAVRTWAQAWADKNMAVYLAAYGKDFQIPGNVPRASWEQDRHLRITSKSRISVKLLELQITVNGDRAVAKFRQDYKADTLAVLSRKTLELVRSGDRWLIVKEATGG